MKMFISDRHKASILFSISFSIGFLTISCSADTKFYECKQIVDITIDTSNQITDLSDNLKTKDTEKVLQVADAFEAAAKKMEAVPINDEKLLEYQADFAKFYRNHAQVTRNFIEAREDKNLSAAKLARQKLQKLGDTEKELVTAINNYCQEN
ncbi:MAG: hypothetical protein QNJ54_04180 [Prochloraceae cyanobacterium]|nr:hypothetical protein [Prochloraceae cyanobacterium]